MAGSSSSPRLRGFWYTVLSAVIFFGTWIQYQDLTALEAGTRESVRLNILLRMLYDAFGIWGVVVTMGLVGVGLLGAGLKLMIAPSADPIL